MKILKDDNDKLSMMRLSHLICMILSTALIIASITLAFFGLEYSSFVSGGIAFAGIGTAGKATQKFKESKE